jgi:hypothetical protein
MPSNSLAYRFPPYGVLNRHFRDVIQDHKPFPNDWTGFLGGSGSLLQQWQDWKKQTLEVINKVLWPSFDPAQGWINADFEAMARLTETDFKVQEWLRPLLDKPAASAPTTNREFFENEDTQAKPFGSMHAAYDPTLPLRLLEKLPGLIIWNLGSKAGTAAPQLKQVLQRPRGYQIAEMWGRLDFQVERAISADSPSMCSGHAYEGTMCLGGVIERFLLNGENLAPQNWLALQQYAVDIGDRRVMAGVHYPSDNLSSWIMVMRISNSVFSHPRVKPMLWEAISRLSHVYAAICQAIDSGHGDAYVPAVKALEQAAKQDD